MSRLTSGYQALLKAIDRFPLQSFFIALVLLFGFLGIAHFLQRTEPTPQEKTTEAKTVETYAFGESPKLTVSARIEKSGVISVYAQSPGIVQKIQVQEGKRVSQGQTLISLSTNYQGGNAASLTRQIAQKNFNFTQENFELQKELINRQKDVATKGNLQASEMRELSRQSLGDTRSLIAQNEEILSALDTQIRFLEFNNVNGSNDAALASARQGRLAASSGLLSLRSSLRTIEYQSDEEKTPAQLSDLSKDLTLKQLELQEKSLVLAKELSGLNLRLARVSEGLMYPATPCGGVVE
nr:biotin/lipoyl-binding protein [Candidatus Woesebacteria bacterium]